MLCQMVNMRWSYFAIFWKYVDLAFIAMGLAALIFYLTSSPDVGELKTMISQSQQKSNYQNFYPLAAAKHRVDVIMAALLFIAWIKVST